MRRMQEGCAGSRRVATARPWEWGPACLPALLLVTTVVLALPGCGHSPSTTFFALSAVRPDTPAHVAVAGPLQLRAVHIPELLDRSERVREVSGNRLQIDQFQQWGAPLADMIRRVLSEDLSDRLPAGTVIPPEAPAPPGTRGLVLDVQEFLPQSNGQVLLQATWSVLAAPQAQPDSQQSSGGSKSQGGGTHAGLLDALKKSGTGGSAQAANPAVLASGTQRLELPAGGSADAEVSAMSRLLGRLADAIAAELNRPPSS